MLSSTDRFVDELRKELSSENVLSELEERYAYAQDASNSLNIYNIPDAVVFVRDTKDVVNVINKADKYKIPVICRGAGTNTVGACRVEHGGIILNFSKMNKILEINKENMTAKRRIALQRYHFLPENPCKSALVVESATRGTFIWFTFAENTKTYEKDTSSLFGIPAFCGPKGIRPAGL